MGNPVDVESLNNPKMWEAAAIAYRISEGEDLMSIASKYYDTRKATVPMTPTHTETPSAGGPPQAATVLTPEEKAGAKFFGVTDEQWIATKRAEGK
jgi:phage I-like protein